MLKTAACQPFLVQSVSRLLRRTISSSSRSEPLSLYICAADEASDQAGAALVTALKQLTGRDVELHGVVSSAAAAGDHCHPPFFNETPAPQAT